MASNLLRIIREKSISGCDQSPRLDPTILLGSLPPFLILIGSLLVAGSVARVNCGDDAGGRGPDIRPDGHGDLAR